MRRALLAASLLAAATPGAAQSLADYDYENLAFRGVGLDAGYLWANKIRDTHQYGVRLDLGYLGPGVRIVPTLTYWSSEFTRAELDRLAERMNQQAGTVFIRGSDLEPIQWSDLSLSIDGIFVWNTPLRVLTFIGVGGGLHALNGQGSAVDDTFVEDLLDSITAGVNALAGLEFEPIHRFRFYAEGRYTALNSIQYLTARGGLQIMFYPDEGALGAVVAPPPLRGEDR
ncbi:MAG TPA: hypothetical protein VMM12_16025 [Longimicrobiales bacterium]|nr:hypothetical protein [Longimicrobiales bacterium]